MAKMTPKDLLSDLVPVIYRLRALHREQDGEKGSELEGIMMMLMNLDQHYSRAHILSLMKHIDEIITDKVNSDISNMHNTIDAQAISLHIIAEVENQMRDVDPDIFTITNLPSVQPTSKYVSLFDMYNFDDYEGYEGLDRTLEQLKSNPNDLSAWDKMLTNDPMDILEHPSFHDVQALLSTNLAKPRPNLDVLTRIYALVAKYVVAYPNHFQGAQICKLFLTHLLNLPHPLLSVDMTIGNLVLVLEFLSFYLPTQRGDVGAGHMVLTLLARNRNNNSSSMVGFDYLSMLLQFSAGSSAVRLYVQSQIPILPELDPAPAPAPPISLLNLLLAVGQVVEEER
ncbi:hypothetical protein EON65_57620, partial [archaeon]